ncbi:MAG: hypothetical protein GY940_05705 [bacterium]|nr:hypothetical protein [bacterium]
MSIGPFLSCFSRVPINPRSPIGSIGPCGLVPPEIVAPAASPSSRPSCSSFSPGTTFPAIASLYIRGYFRLKNSQQDHFSPGASIAPGFPVFSTFSIASSPAGSRTLEFTKPPAVTISPRFSRGSVITISTCIPLPTAASSTLDRSVGNLLGYNYNLPAIVTIAPVSSVFSICD